MPFGATGAWASDATGVAVLEIGLVVLASLLCGLAGVGLRRGWRALVGAPTVPSPLYYHLVEWLVVALQIAVTLLGAPHRVGTPVLDRGLPLDLCAVAMILTVVAGEALLRHVVHEPRVLLVTDPLTAQRADDLLRALTLTLIQGSVLAMLGGVSQVQWALLNVPGGALPVPLSAITFLASYPLLMVGMVTFALRGRLGGAITGWAWTGRGVYDGAAAAYP